jgi:predicted ATPase/Tfp pilus assembly protein PilF
VPPLAVPDRQSGQWSFSESASRFPAVALFVQRAQAVKPDFALADGNQADVVHLCRELDGLPLAIELAAAQVKYLSPRLLLAQLARRLDLLSAGSQDLPPRQRTMRDAIAWSYDLLAAEQKLFCRLAVFTGGCDVEAVTAVCAGPGDLALDPLRGLIALVDRSLLTPDDQSATDSARFRMLETIREFAQEQLDARGETEALRQRHADYFLALAEQAEPALWGTADQASWTQRLDADLDNLRSALSWRLARGHALQALQLASRLGMYWFFTGRLSEGRRWLEAALDAAPEVAPDERARALCHLGGFALSQADHRHALPELEESLELWQALDDPRWTALVLFRLAHAWRDAGELARAKPLFEASLALSREQGEGWGVIGGIPLVCYGTLLLEQGDDQGAMQYLEEALALGRRSRNPILIASALNGLAWIAHATGDPEQARAMAEESLALYEAIGMRQGRAEALSTLGWVALWSGNVERATQHFAGFLHLSWESGHKRFTANALRGLGLVAFERGELERGARRYAQAATLWPIVDLPHAPSKAAVERCIAQARAQLGEPAWRAAWAVAASLTPDEAIATVLAELQDNDVGGDTSPP